MADSEFLRHPFYADHLPCASEWFSTQSKWILFWDCNMGFRSGEICNGVPIMKSQGAGYTASEPRFCVHAALFATNWVYLRDSKTRRFEKGLGSVRIGGKARRHAAT